MKGRKRHLAVDTFGDVLRVCALPADILDAPGAVPLFEKLKGQFELLVHFWADRAYRGWLVQWVKEHLNATLAIVAKPDGSPAFVHLPRRWIVERMFAWLGRFRRLSKDYEQLPAVSEFFVYVVAIRLLRLRAT